MEVVKDTMEVINAMIMVIHDMMKIMFVALRNCLGLQQKIAHPGGVQ